MSEQKEYKPVPLTRGPQVNYGNMLRAGTAPRDLRAKKSPENSTLESLGIKGKTEIEYRKDENGNPLLDANGRPIVIKKFTPTEVPAYFTHAIMVLNGHEPCYFEGCEQIVSTYKQELSVLESRPGGCRDCDRGRLQRKFAALFRNALPPAEANKLAQPTIPPHTVTNLTTKQTVQVPRKAVPYATIRREVPESLKEAFTSKLSERKLIVNSQVIPIDSVKSAPQPDTGTPGGPSGTSAS